MYTVQLHRTLLSFKYLQQMHCLTSCVVLQQSLKRNKFRFISFMFSSTSVLTSVHKAFRINKWKEDAYSLSNTNIQIVEQPI